MKKIVPLFALVLTLGALVNFAAPKVVASTTGYLYGHGLFIESVTGTGIASISNAGALSVTSIVNTGALSATNVTATGYVQYASKSKAQIEAITPSAAGQSYYCSDCIDAAVCVSTGTGVSAWVQISSKTVACN